MVRVASFASRRIRLLRVSVKRLTSVDDLARGTSGQRFASATHVVTADEIKAFARQLEQQPRSILPA